MIAKALNDCVYSEEEMADILFSRNARLVTPEARKKALRRRIQTRTEIPPCSHYEGEYYFPKEAFREWALKRPLVTEVKRVG
jgi:hypothetical protein